MKPIFALTVAITATSVIAASPSKADGYVPCSFNYQVISCKIDRVSEGEFQITWRDGKKMNYYGARLNNNYLRDSLGGNWKYLDFDVGRSFSLSNLKNDNVIIWNGTYRQYGQYVGL